MPAKRKQNKKQEKDKECSSENENEMHELSENDEQEGPNFQGTTVKQRSNGDLLTDLLTESQQDENTDRFGILTATTAIPSTSTQRCTSKSVNTANVRDTSGGDEDILTEELPLQLRAEGPRMNLEERSLRPNIGTQIDALQREVERNPILISSLDENRNMNRTNVDLQEANFISRMTNPERYPNPRHCNLEVGNVREFTNRDKRPLESRISPRISRQRNNGYERNYGDNGYARLQMPRITDFRPNLYENHTHAEPISLQTRPHYDQNANKDRIAVSGANLKLPAFTGNDDWKVWIRRFEAIAQRRNWSDEEKLDEILPRLQGGAGEFVFTQLPSPALSNYHELVTELEYRYRIIENTKSYMTQFANRDQNQGEKIEEYAAELKRLHHKAYPKRERNQRREDLLERFMRGILDEEVRFFVNYMKKPTDIDEAVYAVVECTSERQSSKSRESNNERKARKHIRRTSPFDEEYEGDTECETDEEIEEKVLRLKNHQKQIQKQNLNENGERKKETNLSGMDESETKNLLQKMQERISMLEKQAKRETKPEEREKTFICFNCNKSGHISRNCRAPRNHNRSREQNYGSYARTRDQSRINQQTSNNLNSMGQPWVANRKP